MAECVSRTVSDGLCVSCGACARVCPGGAIREVYRDGLFVPEIDAEKCNGCGMCRRVCPSAPTDVAATYGSLDFDGPDPLACRIVHARDGRVREMATSGGFVPALAVRLLSDGKYSRAFVLKYDDFRGEKAEVRAVESAEGVLAATKSKYVPAGIGDVVTAVREGRIGGSIVVGTPCQLLAVRKAMDVYRRSPDDVLFIGLFCDMALDYGIYEEFRSRYGGFAALNFRDKRAGGWPGDTTMVAEGGELRSVDRSLRMSLKGVHSLGRCSACVDKLNALADISVGDSYVPGTEDPRGESCVVVRTPKGEAAFAAVAGDLECSDCPFEAVKASQGLSAKEANVRRALAAGVVVNAAVPGRARRGGAARPFNVLVDVEGFANRGDQLMLDACVRQVRARLPHATLAVPAKAFLEDPSWCMARRIRPMLRFEGKASKRLRQKFRRFVARRLLDRVSFLLPDEIDLVLFAAGFNYGDQFAEMYTERNIADEVAYYASFSKKGRRFVLMPQALGPFRTPQAREKMMRLFPHVDLVFAREPVSFAHIREMLPDAPNIRESPDFTCLCEPVDVPVRLAAKSYVALVPNMRMVDRTPEDVSRAYVPFCVRLVRALAERGETVVLVNHEGRDDETLCHEINAHFGNSLTVLSGLSGIDCKAVLARSKLVVSSRFHGVVSGLVEGVPTLCTSWSHKYGELLKEHGRPGNALDVRDAEKSVRTVLDALERPADYASAPGCVDTVRRRTRAMWDEVFSLLPPWARDCAEPKYRLF